MSQCVGIGPRTAPGQSEISTVAIPNRHNCRVQATHARGFSIAHEKSLLRRSRTRILELSGRLCSVLQDARAACADYGIYHSLCSWCWSPGTPVPALAQRYRGCASTASTCSLPKPRPPPSRAKSDEPELTGMGKLFSFEPLNGYFRSFDEGPENEVEVSSVVHEPTRDEPGGSSNRLVS